MLEVWIDTRSKDETVGSHRCLLDLPGLLAVRAPACDWIQVWVGCHCFHLHIHFHYLVVLGGLKDTLRMTRTAHEAPDLSAHDLISASPYLCLGWGVAKGGVENICLSPPREVGGLTC